MDKSLKEGKPWNFGLLQYWTTPISSTLPSPLEILTGRKPCLNLPQIPSSIGHNMDTSRIRKELLRRQPANTSTSTGATELEPGQPVFVKEVHGNVWRTATIDQPAAEPDSYWVRFPDNSILRRTRSMIKPRSLPSHFELQAEAQQRNFEGETSSHSHTSFNLIHQRCSSSLLHPIQKVIDDVLVTFHVCKLCSGASVSFIQYRLVKHEHCGLHSSPLVLFQISALVTLNACFVWQIKIL